MLWRRIVKMCRSCGNEDTTRANGRNATMTLDEQEKEDEEEEEEYSKWDDVCRSFSELVYGEEEVGDAAIASASEQLCA